MDEPQTYRRISTGVLGGGIFFIFVTIGGIFIVRSKSGGLSTELVALVPVLIMVIYACLMAAARLFRLRDDQAGDNLYYMGFLFTLTSLAVSLHQFSAEGAAELVVQNFGIAISSTIAGIALRVIFQQMLRDPVEEEASARLELADASRRVKRELENTVTEFAYFRRTTQQSMIDAMNEMTGMLGVMRSKVAVDLQQMAGDISKPLEEAFRKSGDALVARTERMSAILDGVTEQLVVDTGRSHDAGASVDTMRNLDVKLEAILRADESIGNSGPDTPEKNVRTQRAAAAIMRLVKELDATVSGKNRHASIENPLVLVSGGRSAAE